MGQHEFDNRMLDALMPMHLIYDPDGVICSVGRTLDKMRGAETLVGHRIDEVFEIRDHGRGQGTGPVSVATRLFLTFRQPPHTDLKGMAVTVQDTDLCILNLSFGISVAEAVPQYGLSAGDFAHTDLTIELLYVIEAKAAVLEEAEDLNRRLNGEKRRAEEEAETDPLTGLHNRRAMDRVLQRMAQDQLHFSLMQVDLDHFKAVNDRLGHGAGDMVLRHVAEVFTSETRSGDTAARIGGDEFILVFDGLAEKARLIEIARRLIAKIEQPLPYGTETCRVSASIGITTTAFYPTPDPDVMIADADVALYRAKQGGRGRACFHDPVAAMHDDPADVMSVAEVTGDTG